MYCRNPTEHGWHGCPRRLSHQQSDDTEHANAAQVGDTVGGNNVSLAWCTQEDIAFLAVMETGSTTPLIDTAAVLVDTAASHHMVPAESRLCQHVTQQDRLRRTCQRVLQPLYCNIEGYSCISCTDGPRLVGTDPPESAYCSRYRSECVCAPSAPRKRSEVRSTVEPSGSTPQ